MTRRRIRSGATGLLATAALLAFGAGATAATFGELSSGQGGVPPSYGAYAPYSAGPYSAGPYSNGHYSNGRYSAGAYSATPNVYGPPQPPGGGAEGQIPPPLNAPGAATLPPPVGPAMPLGPIADLPMGTQQLWTFGQINSTTDPFNPWGLSTPYMFVPWSTPLAGWANTENWNWWRNRSGAVPRNW